MENVIYANQGATRDKPCTEYLERELSKAIALVYGPDYVCKIYSGGQNRRGQGKRTGSVRHDDFGSGGRAADIYVIDPNGNKIKGEALAPLVQYWAAKKIGGVGIEMQVGGVHLDEWSPPPQRGGMFWYYKYGKGTEARVIQQGAISRGLSGVMPKLHAAPPKPTQIPWWEKFAGIFRRKT